MKVMAGNTRILKISCVVTVYGLLGGWGLCAAQANSQTETQAMGGAMSMDDTFVKKAAQGGMAEVKLGELAQQKGSNDTVKDFGKKMVEDHSKANEELKSTALRDNLSVPGKMDAKDEATYNRLSKLSGAAFDRAYAHDMVQDHQKDVAEFRREANNGKNPDIKNFAAQTLPTLEEHLKLAQQMQQSVAGNAKSSSSQY